MNPLESEQKSVCYMPEITNLIATTNNIYTIAIWLIGFFD